MIMVPAAAVEQTLAELTKSLEPGDIIVDGGNSYYVDTIRRAKAGESALSTGHKRRGLGIGARFLSADWR